MALCDRLIERDLTTAGVDSRAEDKGLGWPCVEGRPSPLDREKLALTRMSSARCFRRHLAKLVPKIHGLTVLCVSVTEVPGAGLPGSLRGNVGPADRRWRHKASRVPKGNGASGCNGVDS